MSWQVGFTKKAQKQYNKMGDVMKDTLQALISDIATKGPVRGDWPNYSKLSDGSHHCHLNYNTVTCWREIDGKVQLVEVYYAGSRKDAPY